MDADILLLEPTSGSTGGTKWIPYTQQLQREFLRAVNPWIAALYLRHPSLFVKTHYWSISPYTEARQPEGGKRRGFAEDRDYLSPLQKTLTRHLFPVPAALASVQDPRQHSLLTLLYLLDAPSLGLVSVWHPSALLALLALGTEAAETLAAALSAGRWPDGQQHRPNPTRAQNAEAHLKAQDYAALFPSLKVISCWDSAFAAADADRLRKMFPKVEVQGKGLIATEGIVTIPWRQRHVAAITAHTLHLDPYDMKTGERDPAHRIPVHAAEAGKNYSVVLTTGNGFTDYPLGDIVRCVGHIARTPCLAFQFRSGGVVDLHGEKLHAGHVADIIARLEATHGAFRFAMLMPCASHNGYAFVCREEDTCTAEELEALLCESYHYRHARNLRQLDPVRIVKHPDALAAFCAVRRCSPAAVKVPHLYVPRDASEWRGLAEAYLSCEK
ncbi:MAG: GH3 auxin-responsive promoter family protein [Kiritimatiellaeota bacterium]|nr:GH3 auxin-responsive promoter family protein [Kiritimatiellota bacterium]